MLTDPGKIGGGISNVGLHLGAEIFVNFIHVCFVVVSTYSGLGKTPVGPIFTCSLPRLVFALAVDSLFDY